MSAKYMREIIFLLFIGLANLISWHALPSKIVTVKGATIFESDDMRDRKRPIELWKAKREYDITARSVLLHNRTQKLPKAP
jgi:hypothetical protein